MSETSGVFPYSDAECRRLEIQSLLLRALSESFLRSAGIQQGMRVLDIGCATGGLTFLISSVVGKEGHVVGLDRCREVLQKAAERSSASRQTNVEFVCADLHNAPTLGRFDAIVGRFILAYVRELDQAIRALLPALRDGGVMAFQEWDHSRLPDAYPRMSSFDQLNEFVILTLQAGGVRTRIVQELYATLSAVARTGAEIISSSYLTADIDGLITYLLYTVRALETPARALSAGQFDKVTSTEFLDELKKEADAKRAVLGLSPVVGVWAPVVGIATL